MRSLGRDLSEILGYRRLILKEDQEPAINMLRATVRREYNLDILNEESAVAESQSNGEVENAIGRVVAQIRRLGQHIPEERDIIPRRRGKLDARWVEWGVSGGA